jgi:hypothetical protein
MRNVLNLMLMMASLVGIALAPPPEATAQTSLCAMLSTTDVTAVVGMPLKLTESKIDTATLGGGAGNVQSQTCNYDPPGGIGSGPTTVRATMTSSASPSQAALWFKTQLQFLPSLAGKADPLAGVGDEAVMFHAAGGVYVRKKNLTADIHVGRRDLDLDQEVAAAKTLARKFAGRVQ